MCDPIAYIDLVMNAGTNNTNGGANATSPVSPSRTHTMKAKSDASLIVRLPSSIKDGLMILADKDDRKMSDYVKRVLASHVATLLPPVEEIIEAPIVEEITYTKKATKPKAKAKK
jgi:hypothetical protein